MSTRSICVVTGTRAEYGLLSGLMKEIAADSELLLQVVATGMHLSPEFGLTYKLIEQDGFRVDAKVEMLLSSDSPTGIAKSMGLGVIGFADAFERLQPDVVVVLGDRFEILAAVQAALVARIPVAHIHGGETTEGAVDESIRHAITKMSHLHFTAAEPYRRRVLQLGEQPERVWNTGAPGLDAIAMLQLPSRAELEEWTGLLLRSPFLLVTYHPATLGEQGPEKAVQALFDALEHFSDATVVFTGANADASGRVINAMVTEFVQEHSKRMRAFTTMGQLRYLGAMKCADAVVGNSSSGIIEAPFLKTPTVNIGDRQRGRLQASSIINCREESGEIVAAIQRALSSEFRSALSSVVSLYGSGTASATMKELLKSAPLSGLVVKRFNDVPLSV